MFFSTRHFSPLFTLLLLAAMAGLLPDSASASTLTYWTGMGNSRHSSGTAACKSYNSNAVFIQETTTVGRCELPGNLFIGQVGRITSNCPNGHNASTLQCNSQPPVCQGDSTFNTVTNSCELNCESPKVPDPETMTCKNPEPQCEPGQFYDFETNSCKWPQDDTCSAIGASWNDTSKTCQCSAGKLLVIAAGVSRCMSAGDDSCTSSSPDFKGYGPFGPVCNASARCPNGGTPGHVGQGENMTVVCIPPVGENDGEGEGQCNGTTGIKDGVIVCIPKPGTDPDLPDCKGVVGTVGNQKVCIEPASNDSRCKPGETAGYTGVGSDMKFICIPKGYGPETCPPGQYVINKDTEGFGCATASGDNPSDDPTKNAAGKTPGKVTGNSTTEKKDGEGNTTESSTSDFNFQIEGLFHDAPENNFKTEMDEFGTSALDSTIDIDGVVSEFGGSDGAFTQRSSLDNASAFIKTHTVGNTANCSGALNFLGYNVSCDKFTMYNRIIGWMIFVLTAINIYNTLMRKSDSGV